MEDLKKYMDVTDRKDEVKEKQVKKDFQEMIVEGRKYFEFEDKQFYVTAVNRKIEKELMRFDNNRMFENLKAGYRSMSEVQKECLFHRDNFPLDIFVCTIVTKVDEDGDEYEEVLETPVTDKEEHAFITKLASEGKDVLEIMEELTLQKKQYLAIRVGTSERLLYTKTAEYVAQSETDAHLLSLVTFDAETDTHVWADFEQVEDDTSGLKEVAEQKLMQLQEAGSKKK